MDNKLILPCNVGSISDGYHTFDELYEHRHMLFIALQQAYADLSWKSLKHSDGQHAYEGWFITGMQLPTGQITYHLPIRLWHLCTAKELEVAPEWDGHTSQQVVKRLHDWVWRLDEKVVVE